MKLMPDPAPVPPPATAGKLVDHAREIGRSVMSRLAEIDGAREVPADIIDAMRAAGLFRILQPARWGGYELDPAIVLDAQAALAETCMSTAWVYGVLCVQSFLLARFDSQAQAEVWGETGDMLISSSFQPTGTVTRDQDGFRLKGRWSFSSGSAHAGWVLLGGLVPPVETQGRPEMRLFLLPRADYRIVENWNVIGLQGTGSNDVTVENRFVPGYRSHAVDAGLLPLGADSGLAPVHRLPWLYMFTSMIANPGIGAGRGAARAFAELAQTRSTGLTGVPARQLARLVSELDLFEMMTRRNLRRQMQAVEDNAALPLAEALLYRSQLTGMMRKIAALVDELMLASGGRGIRRDSPLSRFWLDLCAARSHAGNDPDATLEQLAGISFPAP